MVKQQEPKTLSTKDYEKLGRSLESIFEGGYINHHRVYKINFLRGIFFGLGSVIGGTIVLTCLIWILTFFSEVPFLGALADVIKTSLES